MKYSILFIIFLGNATAAFAQINESDTFLLQVRASLSGNYQKGNVNLLTVRSRLDFSVAPVKQWVLKSQNVGLYQAFGTVKADNDVFSRNFLYFRPQKRVYPFAIAFVSTNYRRKIEVRAFTGLGGTVQLMRQPNHLLKASVGVVYESTRFNGQTYNVPAYDGKDNIAVWRATSWLYGRHDLLQKRLRCYYDFYWQPAFDNTRNYRWQTDAGLEFPFWKGLSFNLLYTFTHENIVLDRVKKDDQILTFGIAYAGKVSGNK